MPFTLTYFLTALACPSIIANNNNYTKVDGHKRALVLHAYLLRPLGNVHIEKVDVASYLWQDYIHSLQMFPES